ncbi:MAG: alpha/beta hydrolase [Polyangiaceae bacterium]|nr:alpha/beta hydrolase [Polyangiaceae bacterium]
MVLRSLGRVRARGPRAQDGQTHRFANAPHAGRSRTIFVVHPTADLFYDPNVQHTFLKVPGNGLTLRVHRFSNETAKPSGLTVLLLHGYMDAGGTWDLLAPHLTDHGHVLLAPDLRGFGESDPIGAGGYYHFLDYVADIDALVRHLVPKNGRLAVVGHSMGGTVASLFTGSRPDRVERLALLEGLGPPHMEPSVALDRTRAWLRNLEEMQRAPRRLTSMEDAVRRLVANHPRVPRDVLTTRAQWLTRNDGDGLVWAYDPLHRTTSPMPFQVDVFRAFLRQISCPTLVVGGGPFGFHPEDEMERAHTLANVEIAELPNAGHMMHWTEPHPLGQMLARFFGGPIPST